MAWASSYSIQIFAGSPLDRADLERVRAGDASMTFILADLYSQDSYTEDLQNILIATAFEKIFYPIQHLTLRL